MLMTASCIGCARLLGLDVLCLATTEWSIIEGSERVSIAGRDHQRVFSWQHAEAPRSSQVSESRHIFTLLDRLA